MAWAQSTSSVGVLEKPQRWEIAVGQEFHSRSGTQDNYSERSLVTGAVGWRVSTDGIGGARVMVRGYHAAGRTSFSSPPYDYRFDNQNDVLAVVVMTDWVIHITPGLTIAPSAGGGIAPYVHSQRTSFSASSTADPPRRSSSAGLMWSSGVVLRYGHLMVEQELSGLVGPVHDMVSNAYMPTLIGWRF